MGFPLRLDYQEGQQATACSQRAQELWLANARSLSCLLLAHSFYSRVRKYCIRQLTSVFSNALENIQKSALGIVVPSMSYSQALHLTGLPSLQGHRESACIRFISKISPGNPLYALISSRSLSRESPYNLRRNTNITVFT